MIDGFEPYPEYKDSGVPWLGEVPEHWEVLQIGRVGSLFKGNGGNKGDEVPVGVPCVRYGDLYTRYEFFIKSTKAYVSKERAADYTSIRYGDILFAASGETIEDIGRSAVNLIETDVCCGGDILVLRPKMDVVSEFLGYASDSAASRHQKACMGRGFTVVHIYGSQLKRLVFPFPPLPEQTAIVRFLDWADRRIRRVIRARERRIKLLEEYKQALINQAVTGQIDVHTGKPYLAYKDSGVEWLGEVPEHWKIVPLKRLATSCQNGATPPTAEESYYRDGTIPWYGPSSCDSGETVSSPVRFIANAAIRKGVGRLIHGPALLVVVIGATAGKMTLMPQDGTTNQQITAFELPYDWTTSLLLLRQLRFSKGWLRETASTATIPILNTNIVTRLPCVIPPPEERRVIMRHLNEQMKRIDAVISAIRPTIDLLREYRTRLIADVVTGKLDVRGYNVVEETDTTPRGG